MSKQIIKYTINEILSVFVHSNPPEFLSDVSKIFVEESRTPIGNYPKNLSKITVSPKNTNLKATKSEPIRNEQQNFQNKVSEFSPKLIKQQNDNKIQSTEFVPSFNPTSVGMNNKNIITDSDSLLQTVKEDNNFEANSNDNSQLSVENQMQDAPIFIQQDTPFLTPPNHPILIPQNPATFPSENSSDLFPQYPPGFYPQNYPFFDNSPPIPFSPQFNHSDQNENQNYDNIFHTPVPFPEQPVNQLFNPIQSSTDSNYHIADKEQADEFKSVIDATPNTFHNDSYLNQQNEYMQSPIISSHISPQDLQQQQYSHQMHQYQQQQHQYPTQLPQYQPQSPQNQPQISQYQPELSQYQPELPQYQPELSQYQPELPQYQPQYQPQQQQYQSQPPQFQPQSPQFQPQQQQYQHQPQPQYQQQLPPQQQLPHQQQQQLLQQSKQNQQQQNQQFSQSNNNSLNKEFQHNKDKNEKKPKSTFSADTVIEDVKNVKIAPWGQVKPKVSQKSFQEIEKSAKANESSNPSSSNPTTISFSSSKATKPKITITNSPIIKNENGKNKKANRNQFPPRPSEIPKPANFTADNIAISQASEISPPPKQFVVYNKNFSSVTPMQIQNVDRNTTSFTITTQNNTANKPAGFNPGNIAIPPNFANNYPP